MSSEVRFSATRWRARGVRSGVAAGQNRGLSTYPGEARAGACYRQPLVVVFAALLDSTPIEQAGASGIWLSLTLGVVCIVAVVATVGYILWQRRKLDERLDTFIRGSGFRTLVDEADLRRVSDKLDILCGVGAKIFRAAIRNDGPFELLLVAFRFPQYRVEPDGSWDEHVQESDRRVALLVSGFGAPLPEFRLLPNNWAVRALRGHRSNRFGDVEPFGAFNYVMAHAQSEVRGLLGGELQRMLGRNRWLAIDGRADFLAFYGNGDAEQPADLRRFLDHSLRVSGQVRERVGGLISYR